MTKDKLLTILKISGIITAILDVAFITFVIVQYTLLWTGEIFVKGYFTDIILAAIVINAVFLSILAIYLIFRKK
ncbi:MAG: hypothetical protein ACOCWI_04530 [Bacillota bacterium]